MYTLTITDDATRYVSVRFLRNKESVLDKFERWLSEAEGQSGRRLKRIRTDNGLEFCSKPWENLCSSRGIHERTMVYAPQQNDVAERLPSSYIKGNDLYATTGRLYPTGKGKQVLQIIQKYLRTEAKRSMLEPYLDECLKTIGFQRDPIEPCVYRMTSTEGSIILATYVDDLLVLSENAGVRKKTKQLFNRYFECKHLGHVSYLLGIKFGHSDDGSITSTQEAYVEQLLWRFNMIDAMGVHSPMELGPSFPENEELNAVEPDLPYREIIGALLL